MSGIAALLAGEIGVAETQIEAAIGLLEGGDTVPFIARYRKEITGGLDDVQLRMLQDRLAYVRELADRRAVVLEALAEQGVTDPALLAAIREADTKARLEDLYLPYRDKRRTRVQVAIDAGLQPLAELLMDDPTVSPETRAAAFVDADRGVADADAALSGARLILSDRFSSDAELMGRLRDMFWRNGRIRSRVREGKEVEGANFSDHFDRSERFADAACHRVLAMFRGERMGFLELTFDPLDDDADPRAPSQYDAAIRSHYAIADRGRPGDAWLVETTRWAWRTKALIHLEMDVRTMLWERAERGAIEVFSNNLRDVLMSAPAGNRTVLAMDPGFRNGVKCAVLDGTGKVLDHCVLHLHEGPHGRRSGAAEISGLCRTHRVQLIAIGNGTASRETERVVSEVLVDLPEPRPAKVVVSEAGASVYSASAIASQELPDLDVTIRGAVSIGRGLQDPLAELVKIEPKSIGVGQYQHDVSETLLARSLDAVVEDCVNAVGVDVNTASPHLLARIAGLGPSLADAIVRHRDAHGPFRSRAQLLDVPRLGARTFEQCAGFLRIVGGDDPLDRSAVHPEAYPVVERILADAGCSILELMGNAQRLRKLRAETYVDDRYGLPTIKDIIGELAKPGRDPRPSFVTAAFREGVEKPSDLRLGMILEGTVHSVAAFGAFVDIGVHQDGLVHISAMGKSFVDDPRRVVRVGQTVKVKVVSLDLPRSRIGLSMRLDDEPESSSSRRTHEPAGRRSTAQAPSSAMGDALVRAFKAKQHP